MFVVFDWIIWFECWIKEVLWDWSVVACWIDEWFEWDEEGTDELNWIKNKWEREENKVKLLPKYFDH